MRNCGGIAFEAIKKAAWVSGVDSSPKHQAMATETSNTQAISDAPRFGGLSHEGR